MKPIDNPFVTLGYRGAAYFCNRKQETESILQCLTGATPVTLASIRRIGKTGLIYHVLEKLPKGYTGIYLDIQSAENLRDVTNIMATAVLKRFPERTKPGKILWEFVKSLRPVITFEPLSGFPQVTFDTSPAKSEADFESILRFLDHQPDRIILAVDEFQQILQFPRKNTDAWLRGVFQQLKNVTFLFSGSQQHLMADLFTHPSRPFYRNTVYHKLEKIPAKEYTGFIVRKFREGGRQIGGDIAREMLEWADGHTYYVQLLCNRVYGNGATVITTECWKAEALKLILQSEPVFFNYRDLLPNNQWSLLKAIAGEGKVMNPTSGEFIRRHQLSGSASILQSLQALLKKEMIYMDHDAEGKKYYAVYDLFLGRWIGNR